MLVVPMRHGRLISADDRGEPVRTVMVICAHIECVVSLEWFSSGSSDRSTRRRPRGLNRFLRADGTAAEAPVSGVIWINQSFPATDVMKPSLAGAVYFR